MKKRLLLNSFLKQIVHLAIICLIGIAHLNAKGEGSQSQPLNEVLDQISEKYQVIITYNAKLLSKIEINFEFSSEEAFESAVNRALEKTELRYKQLTEKYGIVFKEGQTSQRKIKKLTRKFEQIQKLEQSQSLSVQKTAKERDTQLANVIRATEELLEEQNLSGLVSDANGQALVGATVRAKGTNQGTLTDESGNFQLTVPDNVSTLIFSYLGYTTQEIEINGRTVINVTLSESESSLDEVVVVGYGTQRKADITGAIGSVSAELLNNTTYASTGALLQGKVAGVRVETNGGSPGAGVNVVIRGSGTFGNDQPLYVVDGKHRGIYEFPQSQ